MASATTSTTIGSLKFSGMRKDYPAFRKEIIAAACATSSRISTQGILTKLISIEDAERLFPRINFNRIPEEKTWTEHLANENQIIQLQNAQELAAYNQLPQQNGVPVCPVPVPDVVNVMLERAIWKEQNDDIQTFQNSVNAFKMALFGALDGTAKEVINSTLGDSGVAEVALDKLLRIMDKAFLVLTQAERCALTDELINPIQVISPQGMTEHISNQLKIHSLLKSNNEEFNEAFKIRSFIKSFSSNPTLLTRANQFYEDYHRPEDMTFKKISKIMQRFADAKPVPSSLTKSSDANFASAAVSKKYAGKEGGKKRKVQTSLEDLKYCWSHGYCGHDSEECGAQFPGHQAEANKKNKMGGETRQWSEAKASRKKTSATRKKDA